MQCKNYTMKIEYIIHVHLIIPFQDESDYYFGSIAAIYDVLSEEIIGIKKSTLYRHKKDLWSATSHLSIIKRRILKRKSK